MIHHVASPSSSQCTAGWPGHGVTPVVVVLVSACIEAGKIGGYAVLEGLAHPPGPVLPTQRHPCGAQV